MSDDDTTTAREAKVPASEDEVDTMLSTYSQLNHHTPELGVDDAAAYVAMRTHMMLQATASLRTGTLTEDDLERLSRQAVVRARRLVDDQEDHAALDRVEDMLEEV